MTLSRLEERDREAVRIERAPERRCRRCCFCEVNIDGSRSCCRCETPRSEVPYEHLPS